MKIEHVAVVWGGPSAEQEVSRSSAAEVAAALGTLARKVDLLEVGPGLPGELSALHPDVVFPATHGPPGEDGTLQGLLDMLALPYVGSGVEASAAAMNKHLAKALFADAGLPVAEGCLIEAGSDPAESTRRAVDVLGTARAVVKPTRSGSALGVSLADDANALHGALRMALDLGDDVLVERRIDGAEITVGVLDLEGTAARALPVIQIETPEASWYDYAHRYTPGASEHLIPAPLPADVLRELGRIAVRAHEALGCRDLSRADFVYSTEGPVLLEVNTLPGMTPTSLYPDAARAEGISFEALMGELCQSAIRRGPRLRYP